ncbi:thioester-containing protein 1 allele R1-like [Anopheles ziemanni]|uniref:thioester-containing protein 1 allele R1-like n=1 Tax=Anopheles coustani TaxID=139045 RepID=UPI002657C8E5|nr:thioester-containing protein 1 allele R1-like [Anopheles coustani]XP_058177564.1 thioester-containing protein 1 allele R1-like [Anopheles ziemanni]
MKSGLKYKICPKGNKNSHYSIVGSAILRPNSEYRICVTTFDLNEAIEFRVSIKDGANIIKSKELTLSNNESRNVTFAIGSIPKSESYELVAEGLSGIIFTKRAALKFDDKQCSMLIQMDKAWYKPGDTIYFRVLVLDRGFKPYVPPSANGMTVFIRDGQGNRVKQWSNVALSECGVFEADLQLSTEPIIGGWSVNVKVAEEEQVKNFLVERYVLPTYSVKVEAPGFVFLSDEVLKLVVTAKYTFGKPVVGELTLSVKPSRCSWHESKVPVLKQTVPIDGKTIVEFNLEELLKEDFYFREVLVEAEVKETLTGRTIRGYTKVKLHEKRYNVSLEEESSYYPGLPYHAWIKITNVDGSPVQDASNPVHATINNRNIDLWKDSLTLDSNGMAKLNVNLDELKFSYLTVHVTYLGERYEPGGISKPDESVKAKMRVRPKEKVFILGNELHFEVASTHPLKHVSYSLLARGELVSSGVIDAADSTLVPITLPSTSQMLPRAKLLLHYITTEGYIVTSHTNVAFDNVYENNVKLTLSKDEAKPGKAVDLTVQTQKNSFVGLLGVDLSVVLLKSGFDLSRDKATEEWQRYESAPSAIHRWVEHNVRDAEVLTLKPVLFWHKTVGAVLLSNRFLPPRRPAIMYKSGIVYASSAMFGGAAPRAMKMAKRGGPVADSAADEPPVRSNFCETWIWESFSVGNEARSISKTIPDTITSWVITGFSLNKTHGLALTDEPSRITVFLPFFLSIDLPYSVKLGETVRIPVVVFNYMQEDHEADLVFFNNSDEFEFVADDTTEAKVFEDHHRSIRSTIARDSGKTFSFLVKPKKVGHITLKLTAKCATAGDAIERLLLVEPEGRRQFINKAMLIDLRTEKEMHQNFQVEIPDDAVPDSSKVELSVIGDVLGSSIENLDSLIRMPFGCGEQNMLNFVPCIVVLDYLSACGRLSVEIEAKAKKYMEVGYQRELTYRHADGSFSAFGQSDKKGSTWLTAFVAKSFQQAAKYVTIDMAIIDKAFEWLGNVQAKDGSFPEVGTVFQNDMQGGSASGIALTAYTLGAFLEFAKNEKFEQKYAKTVETALAYIKSNIKKQEDIYAYALAAYVLEKADRVLTREVFNLLELKATIKGDRKWWSKSTDTAVDSNPQCWWNRPCSVDVEMSAYALMATLEAKPNGLEGLPIMKWLVSQRNDKGGFQSTQDTVVGLQALSKMATSLSGSEANISIKVKLSNEEEKSMAVDRDNVLVLQKYELSNATRELEMSATGSGCALFQLSYKYNIKDIDNSPRFILIPEAKRGSCVYSIELKIAASFIPNADQTVSNMAVMEVDMPSGCVAEIDKTEFLQINKKVKKVETKRNDTAVVLYFDNMDETVVTVQISAFQKHEITNPKPANVTIYDYYDNTRCASSFYAVTA